MDLKKTLIRIVALVICVCTMLTSCDALLGGGTQGGTQDGTQSGNGGNNDKPSGDDNGGDTTAKPTYDIVYASTDIDLSNLRSEMIALTGLIPYMSPASSEQGKNEIVIGDTNRPITEKAKAVFAQSLDSYYDCGYIIYAEGGQIAVYWVNDMFATEAIDSFIDKCIKTMKLDVTDGTVVLQCYSYKEIHENYQWDQIEKKHGREIMQAVKALHAYFQGPKIMQWIANLYDPEIGGFYYSRSARDYEGFYPDLESSQQVFGIIANLTLTGSKINELMHDEVKRKLVAFAQNMQSTEDGYFYHPQWPQGRENLNTDRYGRDQGNALSIINRFTFDTDGDGVPDKQYPLYCTVEGVKCQLHDGTDETCSFPIQTASLLAKLDSTETLGSTVSAAVSKVSSSVVKATASSHPDYSSEAAFLKWLGEYNANIKVNSGGAHNIAAMSGEIKANGYADVLIKWLDEKQAELFEEQLAAGETPTGAWQTPINYKFVWGVYKYLAIYNEYSKPIGLEYAPYIIEACIKVIQLPAEDKNYAYNDLMNSWTAITSVISNINKHYGAAEANKLYEIIRRDPVDLVKNSLEKMGPFRQEDGSFCNNVSGTTSASIYGVTIAIGGLAEGNVNSTHILLNMYGAVCGALGVQKIPLCTEEDMRDAFDTMAEIDPIEKITITREVYDFESGILTNTFTNDKKNAASVLDIREDPTGDSANSLYFYSPSGSSSGDTLAATLSGTGGNAYIFDTRMYIDSDSSDGNIFQIRFNNAYMLQITKSGTKITIKEASSINGDKMNTLTTVNCDEWFHLRMEYYIPGEDTNNLDIPITRVWVNEEHVIDSTNFFGSHVTGATPQTGCSAVTILSLRAPETHLYLDDLYAAKDSLVYDESDTSYPG